MDFYIETSVLPFTVTTVLATCAPYSADQGTRDIRQVLLRRGYERSNMIRPRSGRDLQIQYGACMTGGVTVITITLGTCIVLQANQGTRD
ncbi:hypothetical protein BJV78DRAFT_1356086, partial [Lactifluus subvellereus]